MARATLARTVGGSTGGPSTAASSPLSVLDHLEWEVCTEAMIRAFELSGAAVTIIAAELVRIWAGFVGLCLVPGG